MRWLGATAHDNFAIEQEDWYFRWQIDGFESNAAGELMVGLRDWISAGQAWLSSSEKNTRRIANISSDDTHFFHLHIIFVNNKTFCVTKRW